MILGLDGCVTIWQNKICIRMKYFSIEKKQKITNILNERFNI
jgi:hypothetical protein